MTTTLLTPSTLLYFPKTKNSSSSRTHVGFSVAASSSSLSLKTMKTKTQVSELSFVTSQLGGMKISHSHNPPLKSPSFASPPPAFQPISRRICRFTGKKSNKANKISFSNHKTTKRQFVNLQYKRVWWEAGKRFLKLRLSTKALKTIDKNGLDALAKKAGIDLRKE